MIVREYKRGREKNIYLRENNGTYFLEKITKACGFTIKAVDESDITEFIDNNGYKFVGLVNVREVQIKKEDW